VQVAESAREALEAVPEESWTLLRGDSENANIDGINCAHRFHATIGPTGIEAIDTLYSILAEVLPSGQCMFAKSIVDVVRQCTRSVPRERLNLPHNFDEIMRVFSGKTIQF
jgi:hypothetical protein